MKSTARTIFLGTASTFLAASTFLSAGASADAATPVTITFATWFSSRFPVIQQIASQFNKAHPGIKVVVEHEPGSTTMLTKVLTELATGDAPNIVGLWGPWAKQIANTPGVLPLNSFIAHDHYNVHQFYADNVSTFTVGGKIIGLPADNDNLMVYYNKDLFRKYRVPFPKPNWTWAQMVHTAQVLNHPSQKYYGFLMFVGNTEGVTWRWEPFLWQAGGHLTNSQHTKATFDSPAGIKVMNFYLNLAKYSDVVARSEYENSFQSGHVAMTISGSWNPTSFSNAKLNYGVVPLPAPTTKGQHTTNAGPDLTVILRSTPQKEQASWEFLKFLDNQHNAALQAALGHLPFRPDVYNVPVYQKTLNKYPVFSLFSKNAANARIRPIFSQYSEISVDIGTAIEEVLLHRMSPTQALQVAAQQADQQLTQATP